MVSNRPGIGDEAIGQGMGCGVKISLKGFRQPFEGLVGCPVLSQGKCGVMQSE